MAALAPVITSLPTSQAFEAHILKEADLSATSNTMSSVKTYSSAWDETEGSGIRSYMRRSDDNNTEQQRKELCLEVFRTNPWVSASIDAIAKRITSGGFSIEPVQDKANPENYKTLYNFCLRINDNWDFLQLFRSIIVDLLIFGEAYVEIVRGKDGRPYQLHKIDCITMSYVLDPHGQILKYEQQLSHSNEAIPLNPKDIIRWWLPHPRANMIAQSPIERILDAVNLDRHMVNWITKFFEKGAKSPYWIQHGGGEREATRFLEWFTENFTGDRNAHAPITTWGNTKITEFGKGAIEIDFPLGRERTREETLAGFGVPPMVVGVIKTAGLGGTGEDQEKSFQYNTCDPLKGMVIEKLNWRVVEEGFDIHDHKIGARYADYRNDKDISEVQDKRIRNGSLLVDEARQETGKKPYKDGGSVPIFANTKEIIPLARLNDLEGEQRQQAQIAIQQSAAQADLAKTQAEKAKEPPEPVPPALQQANNTPPSSQAQDNGKKGVASLPAKKAPPQQKDNGKDGSKEAAIALVANMLIEESVRKYFHTPDTHPDFPIYVEAYRQGSWESFVNEARRRLHPFADMPNENEETHTHAKVTQAQSSPQSQGAHSSPGGNTPGTVRHGGSESQENNESLPAEAGGQGNSTAVQHSPRTGTGKTMEDASHHTGMMLAFMLDEETAKQLALPGGEPVSELHITLAYLGDTEEKPEDDLLRPHTSPFKIRNTIATVVAEAKPLSGVVGGVGRFQPAETETTPVIALVDVPGLAEFRTALVQAIEAAGYFIAEDHGYTPHITLAYIDASAPMPVESVPTLPLTLDTVVLCVGGEQTPLKMGDEQYASYWNQKEQQGSQESQGSNTLDALTVTWFPDDLQQRLEQYREQGVTELTWATYPGCCDLCLRNDKVTRPVGEAFPNGAILPQCHNHCQCKVYRANASPEEKQRILNESSEE
jgi:HK97 family phage portal protein